MAYPLVIVHGAKNKALPLTIKQTNIIRIIMFVSLRKRSTYKVAVLMISVETMCAKPFSVCVNMYLYYPSTHIIREVDVFNDNMNLKPMTFSWSRRGYD